jgi:hypothetical protein
MSTSGCKNMVVRKMFILGGAFHGFAEIEIRPNPLFSKSHA